MNNTTHVNTEHVLLNVNDVADLILSSSEAICDFSTEESRLALLRTGYKNAIRLALFSNEELQQLGFEAQASQTLFGRVMSAFTSILPQIEFLCRKVASLFDNRKTVMEDRKALESYMDRIRSVENPDVDRLKSLDLYFYDYKALVGVLSTLKQSIAENDKYLKSILSSDVLTHAYDLGYTDVSGVYTKVDISARNLKQHPAVTKFFESNTLDDLMFVTDQLSRVCTSLEFMLMHDTQLKNTLSNLKTKPNKVKSLAGNNDAIIKLGTEINDAAYHCGRAINNVAVLLTVNRTLTTVTKDVWENVLGVLEK